MIKRIAGWFLLCLISSAVAQEPPAKPPAEEYADRLAKLQKSLADEHFQIGEYLAGQKMFRWARDEYNKALRFNPDHEQARARMAYQRTPDGSWEINPEETPKTANEKTAQEDILTVKIGYDKKNDTLGKNISAKWSDLGNFCSSNKMEAEAVAAWKMAIEYNPNNESPRKKMKYVREGKDGPWLSPFEAKIRKEMKDGIKTAPAGETSTEKSKVETDMGQAHQKRKSKHYLIESPAMTQDQLKTHIQHAEHSYAMFAKVFNRTSDMFSQTFNLVIVKDKPMHERYIDAYHKGTPTKKEFAKKNAGQMGFPQGEMTLADRPNLHDWVIHLTAQICAEQMAGGDRHWLHEGIAYHFTKTMVGTTNTSCVDLAGTGSGGDERRYDDPDNWPVVIRHWVKEAKDPNINEVVKCRNFADLSGAEAVKAWSLVDFLITEHREKLIDFMTKLRGNKEEEDERMLKEVFGWSIEDFDAKWRAYARSAY